MVGLSFLILQAFWKFALNPFRLSNIFLLLHAKCDFFSMYTNKTIFSGMKEHMIEMTSNG